MSYISALFEDIDLKLCTHIDETMPSNILYSFLTILIFEGKDEKKKNGHFFKIFKILKLRHISFVALLILRHFV